VVIILKNKVQFVTFPFFFIVKLQNFLNAPRNSINSGVSGPNVTKIVYNVENFILSNLLKSQLRYCNPFPNGSTTK